MTIRTFIHSTGQIQRLAVGDLTSGGVEIFSDLLQRSAGAGVVYSDPPWNPGNEKYWRRFAGVEPPTDYEALLDAWCECVSACKADHIFCEQSVIDRHRALLLDATERCEGWYLPLIEQWTVQYGSPLRPNVLLHWGSENLASDPSGLHGEAMTRKVFEGLSAMGALHDTTVSDPCTGLGMTSRLAHRFGASFVGTELNSARLARAIAWLLKQGYEERR